MSFGMAVAICTEALLFVIIIATVMHGMGKDIEEKRKADFDYKPSASDWLGGIILALWLGFQFWKAWCVIQTLL